MAIIGFPPVESADEHGLVAVGGDFELSSLVLAYTKGIFPWPINDDYPYAWFSPDPRAVLFCDELHLSTSFKKFVKKSSWHIKFNQRFEDVLNYCSKVKRQNQDNPYATWITDELKNAYLELFFNKMAYSLEVYEDNSMIGGIFGVTMNQMVTAESMFYLKSNASKFAVFKLVEHLKYSGVSWIDIQVTTEATRSFNPREMTRNDFLKILDKAVNTTTPNLFFR